MNDQSQMMNQMNNPVQSQMMNPNPVQSQMMNPNPVQILNQMNHPPLPPPPMNQHPVQPLMMNRTYKPWQQQQQQPPMKPNFSNSKPNRSNWKGKKVNTDNNNKKQQQQQQQRKMDPRRVDNKPMANSSLSSNTSGTTGYNPPTLHELQSQNRLKARKFYPKKKFNNRFAPYAPRNTTSFIIRAKKAGGIASLVSPCPVTPAVLPTPIFSPSREVLGDMAKEEWGVDGYGSMKGLIRLRNEMEVVHDEEEEEDGNGSSDSDVEEHVEVERRLDHDLSRFEMIYPNYGGGGGGVGGEYNNVLENRVDDQDSHIAQLEEENLTLKERLFLMERELGDLRRRLQFLERRSQVVVEDVNEEVVENESENDSSENNNNNHNHNHNRNRNRNHNREVMVEYVSSASGNERNVDGVGGDVCMEEFVVADEVVAKVEDESKDGGGEAMNVVGKDDTDESKGEEKEILGNEIVAEKIDNESKCREEEMNVEQHRMVAEKEE